MYSVEEYTTDVLVRHATYVYKKNFIFKGQDDDKFFENFPPLTHTRSKRKWKNAIRRLRELRMCL